MTKGSQKCGLQFQVIQLWAMGKARNNFGNKLSSITTNIENPVWRKKQALARTIDFGCYLLLIFSTKSTTNY